MGQRESLQLEGQLLGGYDVREVEVESIRPPVAQLRIDLDAEQLEELSRSIAREGLINIPTVRAVEGGFEVVAGHRRVEAVRLLGWRMMPVRVLRESSRSLVSLAAHENLFRNDLSPVEEAAAVAVILDESGGDVDVCAARINRSRSWVDSRLRILRWPADVSEAVHRGFIKAAAGAELAAISDPVHRGFLLEHAVKGGATARTCAAWRIAWEQTGTIPNPAVQQVPPGGTAPAPVEAELPCYLCGRRHLYSGLTHVWLDAECFEVFTVFAAEYRKGNGAGG